MSASEALHHSWFKAAKKSEGLLVSKNFTKNVLTHLRNYRHEMKLHLAVTTFITYNIGKNSEVDKLKLVFQQIDQDCDGKISKEELKKALKQHLGTLAACDSDMLVDEINVCNLGGIEYEEFLRATMHKNKILSEENLKGAFDLFAF